MSGNALCIRRVRRYRKARYPSRHREAARRTGSLARRVMRAAAVPAAALGLGALAGCDHDLALGGSGADGGVEPDAAADVPVAETTVEAAADVPPAEVLRDAAEDEGEEIDYGGINGDMPAGDHYIRYLSEAEGRAVIRDAIRTATGSPTDPCARPTLDERVQEDQWFSLVGHDVGIHANIDLLAPAVAVERTTECPGGMRPDAGFEFLTEEAGDDEDASGDPAGFVDAEEVSLAELRERGGAGIALLRSADYPYDVWEYEGGYVDDSDKARSEELLRETVQVLIDELKRDGLI